MEWAIAPSTKTKTKWKQLNSNGLMKPNGKPLNTQVIHSQNMDEAIKFVRHNKTEWGLELKLKVGTSGSQWDNF